MVKQNETYVVEIEETNIFGNGVCHIDSFIVFVVGAIKGEKCKILIKKVQKKFAYADVLEVLNASPSRITPKCDVYGACGGCSFFHTKIEEENRTKLNFVKSVFKKSRIEADFSEISCPVTEKYRNKVVLFYKDGGFGYNEKGTINVVKHSSCLLNGDDFDKIAELTAKLLKKTTIRALYMRKSKGIMVCPIFYEDTDISYYCTELINAFPNVITILKAYTNDKDFALEKLEFETIVGSGYIEDTICGLNFKISPRSFYQVNKECAKMLYEKAIELLNPQDGENIADLFCGTGTMGLIVASRSKSKVFGVEIEPSAILDAKENAKANNIKNIHLEAMDASRFDEKIDACIIDPPRKGCSGFMIDTLLRLKPKRIVYVSCNPDTMCQDIKKLQEAYTISSPVYTYNMFPRTSHVESVVCLEQNKYDSHIK